MTALSELIAFLEARLALPASAAAKEVPLLWRRSGAPRNKPLRRIGLALEFAPEGEAAADAGWDALFLHRPFAFPPNALPGIPVLASHIGFDAHLTTGYNPALAGALGLREITPLFRPDRPEKTVPIGMIGVADPPQTPEAWAEKVMKEFGGMEVAALQSGGDLVRRVAVMNALNPALITLAGAGGATVYITGQMRENVRPAADPQGISILAAGHERIEQWGLRRLATEISQAFPALSAALLPALELRRAG